MSTTIAAASVGLAGGRLIPVKRWLEATGAIVEPFRPSWLEDARILWWEIFGRATRLMLEPIVATEIVVGEIGPVVGVHAGPATIGVTWLEPRR